MALSPLNLHSRHTEVVSANSRFEEVDVEEVEGPDWTMKQVSGVGPRDVGESVGEYRRTHPVHAPLERRAVGRLP